MQYSEEILQQEEVLKAEREDKKAKDKDYFEFLSAYYGIESE